MMMIHNGKSDVTIIILIILIINIIIILIILVIIEISTIPAHLSSSESSIAHRWKALADELSLQALFLLYRRSPVHFPLNRRQLLLLMA